MKKKELYEAPSVETYDLVPEGNLLQAPSGKFNTDNHTEYLTPEDGGDLI